MQEAPRPQEDTPQRPVRVRAAESTHGPLARTSPRSPRRSSAWASPATHRERQEPLSRLPPSLYLQSEEAQSMTKPQHRKVLRQTDMAVAMPRREKRAGKKKPRVACMIYSEQVVGERARRRKRKGWESLSRGCGRAGKGPGPRSAAAPEDMPISDENTPIYLFSAYSRPLVARPAFAPRPAAALQGRPCVCVSWSAWV